MKIITTSKWLIALLLITASASSLLAQTKADVFNASKQITWLGLDFSQTKFIGSPTKGVVSNKGIVGNDEFRDSYTVQWNELFIDEIKKYDVAKAVHRTSVKYDINVALNANKQLTKKDFYSNSPSDFKLINETTIAELVKNYDFGKNDGIGLIFFVEGMSKGQDELGVWVTFVDIPSKTVLLTSYQTEKPGGFGFRNYWAKPYFTVLKNMESNFEKWNK